MNIYAFCNYKIKHICNYSYTNEDGDFSDGKIEEDFVKSGGELMNLISKSIEESNVIGVTFSENEIEIEEFDSMTGEDSIHRLIIEAVKE